MIAPGATVRVVKPGSERSGLLARVVRVNEKTGAVTVTFGRYSAERPRTYRPEHVEPVA